MNIQADPLLGRKLDGRYTLEELIGEGATGRVYRARQEATGRAVAVKVLRDHDALGLKRFQREAKATSRINHRNAIIVHDFGQTRDGRVYLVTELIEGETLRSTLDRTLLPPEKALWIFREILAGVAAAHEKGVVHRDLHPGNIFLCTGAHGDEQVKVFDFGGARLLDSQEDAEITGVGQLDLNQLLKSIRYLSPERLQRDRRPDPRSDVYSLGLILFELVTGAYPFDADDPLEVMAKHLHEPPPLLSAYCPDRRFSPTLQGLVTLMLAKDPLLRPKDAGEIAKRLSEAEDRDELISLREVVPEPEVEMEIEALPADEEPGEVQMIAQRPQKEPVAEAPFPPSAIAQPLPPVEQGLPTRPDMRVGPPRSLLREPRMEVGDRPFVTSEIDWFRDRSQERPDATARVRERHTTTHTGRVAMRFTIAILCLLTGGLVVFAGGTLAYRYYLRSQPSQRGVSLGAKTPDVEPPPAPLTP